MGTTILTEQKKWCNGLNFCQLQLFLEEVRLDYNKDDDDHHHHHIVNKTNLVHCLVCRVPAYQSSTQNNKYQVSHKHSCSS
jgi:hypothetical protein